MPLLVIVAFLGFGIGFGAVTGEAAAGEADVVAVKVVATGDRIYRFDVTVRHADEGWDHYADGWEVLAPDGTVLVQHTLLHPHDDEQPFTRGLGGIRVPAGIGKVTIRAHDKVHGFGGRTVTVDLP